MLPASAQDDPLGPARQNPPEETNMPSRPVSKLIQEEMKIPVNSAYSVDSNQSNKEVAQLRQEIKEMKQEMKQEMQS